VRLRPNPDILHWTGSLFPAIALFTIFEVPIDERSEKPATTLMLPNA
jgi:hypothetical protein